MNLTTFKGPAGGLYRYRYMPMGLVNAMAIWSRFIDTAMDGMSDFVLCYADDVLIFTKSLNVDDHIRDLEKVFIQFEKCGIKIKASKLKLGLKHMPFLGVIITKEGMIPNPDKTAAIEKLDYPKTLKEIRSILGMFAYYRRFIAKFSEIAAPLYEQTKKWIRNPRNVKGIILSDESKAAFDFLKKAISTEPIMLHYPDWEVPFEIHTDASKVAVAAILCQHIDGKERVLMYASKTLLPAEQRYHIYEQEALAVVWAVEVFRKYIRNRRTIVKTDCSALQWLKSRNEGARVMRWVVKLAEFDLDIQHRKGKRSANVDGITRMPPPPSDTFGSINIEGLYDVFTPNTQTITTHIIAPVATRKRTYMEDAGKKKKERSRKEAREGEKEKEKEKERISERETEEKHDVREREELSKEVSRIEAERASIEKDKEKEGRRERKKEREK